MFEPYQTVFIGTPVPYIFLCYTMSEKKAFVERRWRQELPMLVDVEELNDRND